MKRLAVVAVFAILFFNDLAWAQQSGFWKSVAQIPRDFAQLSGDENSIPLTKK
ncbi:MAG: hypothetical protein U0872_07120 [Planctomycetaceae bacterium]